MWSGFDFLTGWKFSPTGSLTRMTRLWSDHFTSSLLVFSVQCKIPNFEETKCWYENGDRLTDVEECGEERTRSHREIITFECLQKDPEDDFKPFLRGRLMCNGKTGNFVGERPDCYSRSNNHFFCHSHPISLTPSSSVMKTVLFSFNMKAFISIIACRRKFPER